MIKFATNKPISMSSNTFTQIYYHVVFAVKYRRSQIPMEKRDELYAYISGIVYRNDCRLMCIGGIGDHIHMLIRMAPTVCIANLVKSIKIATTNYIAGRGYSPFKFHWQEGYGAFTVSANHVAGVREYINNQVEHHLNVSFIDEYKRILGKNDVAFDPQFIFKELE